MTYDFPEMEEIRKGQKNSNELVAYALALAGAKLTFTIPDVAKIEGISPPSIRTRRYLLPRYGESAYPDGPVRWPFEEVMNWRAIPLEDRINGYREYCETQRKIARKQLLEEKRRRGER